MRAKLHEEDIQALVSRLYKTASENKSNIKETWRQIYYYDDVIVDPQLHAFVCNDLYPGVEKLCIQRGRRKYSYGCHVRKPKDDRRLRLTPDQVDPMLEGPVPPPNGVLLESLIDYSELITTLTGRTDNAQKFAMARFAPDTFQLKCYDSHYFSGLAHCDALRFELLHAWRHKKESILADAKSEPLKHLPLRSQLHDLTGGDPVWNGEHQRGYFAISCLTCYSTGNEYKFTLGLRRNILATGRNRWGVIPSGMFERPGGSQDPKYYSIYETLLREYVEEFYNVDDVKILSEGGKFDWYKRCEEAVTLEELFEDGRAELHVTGMGFNLFSLCPEVLALLVFHDAHWRKKRYELMMEKPSLEFEDMKEFVLPSDENGLVDYDEISPARVGVANVAAIVLGVKLANTLIAERKTGRNGGGRPDPDGPPGNKAMLYRKTRKPNRKAKEKPITPAAAKAIPWRIIKNVTWVEDTRTVREGSTKYDLIIDELAYDTHGVVYTRQDNGGIVTREIEKTDGMGWLMLWLVLCNIGGSVTKADISKYRLKPTAKTGFSIYPKELAKVVSAHTNKSLSLFNSKLPLTVPTTGFSFDWICRSAKPEESWLLHPLL